MAAATSTVSGLAGAALARRPAFSTSTCATISLSYVYLAVRDVVCAEMLDRSVSVGFTSGGRVSARNPLMTRNLERNGRITCMT
jgi:photosystem I subunit PsaO